MSNATIAELRAYLDIQHSTTFTAASATDRLTLASVPFMNTLTAGTEVELTTTAADLPAPLAVNTVYFVHSIVDPTCQLATTSALAEAGTAINITDSGTGTHTISRSVSDTDNLTNALNAAIAYIEQQTGRVFVAASSTKYYTLDDLDDDNSQMLHLNDDLVTLTTLTNGDSSASTISSSYYNLLPRNDGPPYHQILLTTNDGYYWQEDTDYWISVLGTWGYSASCPADVKEAQLHLAAFLYRQAASQVFDITAIPESGVIQIPQGIPATVTRVINTYRRYL